MKRVISLLVPLTFILAVIIPGCYTVIQHPRDESGYRAMQTSDCTGCHYDYNTYPYGHYYSPYPEYWFEFSHYAAYYSDPWWWKYYEYPGHGEGRGDKFTNSESGEPTIPPYAPQTGSLPWRRQPGSLDIPISTGETPTTTGSGRPGVENESRDKEQTIDSGKDTRQSTQTPRPEPTPTDNGKVDNTAPDSTKQPAKETTKKKGRRGGRD